MAAARNGSYWFVDSLGDWDLECRSESLRLGNVMIIINIPLIEFVSLNDGVRAIASIEYAK